jgi:5'-nucleotidase
MKFLLTNDDGIDAPGLQALADAARPMGELLIVAPVDALSGCSHRVTTHQPLRLLPRGEHCYAVDGTPADCVRLALHHLIREKAWILSGINAGGNLGADVYHSGTVAAVREGVLHGLPGVALSHYVKRGLPLDWRRASEWVSPLLRELVQNGCPAGTFWNVNLPHLDPSAAAPEVVYCSLDPMPLPLSFRQEGELFHYNGDYHGRRRGLGTDVDVCFGGKIAVTRMVLF